jgi:hypothetical protein
MPGMGITLTELADRYRLLTQTEIDMLSNG